MKDIAKMLEPSHDPQDRSHEMDVELRRWFESADWAAVPADLAYVAEAAKVYSLIRWVDPDLPVSEFISEQDRMALQSLARQIRERKDLPRIDRFINGRPMTHHPESARIYGLLEVLDELGFRFE